MPSQQEQLREFESAERWRTLAHWCVGLSVAIFLCVIGVVGLGGVGNPETWSSIYVAMAADGFFRWAGVPLLALAMALIVVGSILFGLARRKHGEV